MKAAKSNAARQAEYRARHANDSERLNMLVSAHTKRAIERLARHYGVTQKQILAKLVVDAENAVVSAAVDGGRAYYDGAGQ